MNDVEKQIAHIWEKKHKNFDNSEFRRSRVYAREAQREQEGLAKLQARILREAKEVEGLKKELEKRKADIEETKKLQGFTREKLQKVAQASRNCRREERALREREKKLKEMAQEKKVKEEEYLLLEYERSNRLSLRLGYKVVLAIILLLGVGGGMVALLKYLEVF